MARRTAVVSIHEQIASQIRADVRQGVFSPGDPLREERLAEQFGVSRSPIRQVLQQLTYEGLLHSRPNCGTVVAEPPTPEVAELLYECRAKLECLALRQCFADLDDADFERWRDILEVMYECCDRGDHGGAFQQDAAFHEVIIEKSSPAGSLGVYYAIAGATSDYLRVDKNRPFHADFRELFGMHAALYAIYRLGDLEIACEALSQHILKQEFVALSCRCWTEAGKTKSLDGVYEKLAQGLRRSLKKKSGA
jgi:GntR family transcriptional regulator, rspAB operon transcriptional repressor